MPTTIEWQAEIAPTASAIKVHGGDGSWSVTLRGGAASLPAALMLAALVDENGLLLDVTATPVTSVRYGTRDDDDGSRDDDDERALASVFGSDDGGELTYAYVFGDE